jgi:uncharacterized membrane protein YkvA (DUF1232 family)
LLCLSKEKKKRNAREKKHNKYREFAKHLPFAVESSIDWSVEENRKNERRDRAKQTTIENLEE